MFHECLGTGSIPLAGQDADLFFEDTIPSTGTIMNDASFVATMRALLGKRIGGKKVSFIPVRVRPETEPDSYAINTCNTLTLVYMRAGNFDAVDAHVERMREYIGGIKGFSPVEKVTQFFGRAFKVYAWSNEKQNSAIVLTGNMDLKKLHVLQACIPVVMPWYFKPGEDGEKFTPDEKQLLSSLQETSSEAYLAALKKLAAQYDMREFIIRKRLDGITKRFHEIELSRSEEMIHDYEVRIRDLYNDLEEIMRSRENLMTQTLGLKERLKQDGESSELTDYFVSNKYLSLNRVDGTTVYFTAHGYLENWSEDMAEATINNLNSFAYERCVRNRCDRESFQKLLRAIFVDRSVRIRVYADYSIDLSGRISTEHFGEHPLELDGYMPNPHIENYDCLGDYKRRILECIHGGRIVEAFSYCIASSRSLNWGDGTVMSRFFRNVLTDMTDMKCFELPDGSAVTVEGAIRWAASA